MRTSMLVGSRGSLRAKAVARRRDNAQGRIINSQWVDDTVKTLTFSTPTSGQDAHKTCRVMPQGEPEEPSTQDARAQTDQDRVKESEDRYFDSVWESL